MGAFHARSMPFLAYYFRFPAQITTIAAVIDLLITARTSGMGIVAAAVAEKTGLGVGG